MKKQTNLLTHTQPRRKEWMLLAAIVAMVYRNQSNRSLPTGNLPLNATKEMLVNLVGDAGKLVGKINESFFVLFMAAAVAALIAMVIYYSRIK